MTHLGISVSSMKHQCKTCQYSCQIVKQPDPAKNQCFQKNLAIKHYTPDTEGSGYIRINCDNFTHGITKTLDPQQKDVK